MTIEIVDFPIKNGDFPISYVKLPEGILPFKISDDCGILLRASLQLHSFRPTRARKQRCHHEREAPAKHASVKTTQEPWGQKWFPLKQIELATLGLRNIFGSQFFGKLSTAKWELLQKLILAQPILSIYLSCIADSVLYFNHSSRSADEVCRTRINKSSRRNRSIFKCVTCTWKCNVLTIVQRMTHH